VIPALWFVAGLVLGRALQMLEDVVVAGQLRRFVL
jgi:hypothetical protein